VPEVIPAWGYLVENIYYYLTPFIPLSFKGEGEDSFKRGLCPLSSTLFVCSSLNGGGISYLSREENFLRETNVPLKHPKYRDFYCYHKFKFVKLVTTIGASIL